ncbi:MAG: septum formation protein Maf [Candidatus Omnitrophica bacterium]|nr:septum formation protein Maf [Candidatus Omnitrophota bacterium]
MKQLILASASLQRKKLLKALGVQFTIKSSRIKEVQKIQTTCSSLVKHNALLKAKDVAGQLKAGVVVGADTLVYGSNKQIIGKPRNLKEAKKILHELFSKPHWVYTGVAVIDVETGQHIVDYEKTKVFMLPLTDEEIDLYHAKVSPLDKAGGFDIEGGGSVFIHRIEGCYSNVIGLPIAKLATMLRRVGVSIL